MAREFAKTFYRSKQWQQARNTYMSMFVSTPYGNVPPYMCERCYSQGELKPAKVVHHKTHLRPTNIDDPRISLDFSNLQRLCQDCHAIVHGGDKGNTHRTFFDEQGNIRPRGYHAI